MAGIPQSIRSPLAGSPRDALSVGTPPPKNAAAAGSYSRLLADALRPTTRRSDTEPRAADASSRGPVETRQDLQDRGAADRNDTRTAGKSTTPTAADAGPSSETGGLREQPSAVTGRDDRPEASRDQTTEAAGEDASSEPIELEQAAADPEAAAVATSQAPPRDGSEFPRPPRELLAHLQGITDAQPAEAPSEPLPDPVPPADTVGQSGADLASSAAERSGEKLPVAIPPLAADALTTEESPTAPPPSSDSPAAGATAVSEVPANGNTHSAIPPTTTGRPTPPGHDGGIAVGTNGTNGDAASGPAVTGSAASGARPDSQPAGATARATTADAAAGRATSGEPPATPRSEGSVKPLAGAGGTLGAAASRPQPFESMPPMASTAPVESAEPTESVGSIESGEPRAADAAEPTAARPRPAGSHLSRSHAEPAPGTPRTEVLVERIGEAVRLASQQNRPLRVRLHPPELGVLQVEVVSRGGSVSARLEVQSTAAQQAVLDNLASLRETLSAHNTQVGRIEVHVNETLAHEGLTGDGGQASDESPGQQRPDRGGETNPDVPADPRGQSTARTRRAPAQRAGSSSRLDIQV